MYKTFITSGRPTQYIGMWNVFHEKNVHSLEALPIGTVLGRDLSALFLIESGMCVKLWDIWRDILMDTKLEKIVGLGRYFIVLIFFCFVCSSRGLGFEKCES